MHRNNLIYHLLILMVFITGCDSEELSLNTTSADDGSIVDGVQWNKWIEISLYDCITIHEPTGLVHYRNSNSLDSNGNLPNNMFIAYETLGLVYDKSGVETKSSVQCNFKISISPLSKSGELEEVFFRAASGEHADVGMVGYYIKKSVEESGKELIGEVYVSYGTLDGKSSRFIQYRTKDDSASTTKLHRTCIMASRDYAIDMSMSHTDLCVAEDVFDRFQSNFSVDNEGNLLKLLGL